MRRVGFVVEGKSLEVLFQESLCPWLRQRGIAVKVVNAGGRSLLIRDASRHLDVLRRSGFERIFFVLDQETDPCPPATAKRLDSVRSEPDVVICVAARMLEAWLLADNEAIQRATGLPGWSGLTDSLPDPVSELKDLFFQKYGHWYTKMEMARRVGRYFQLERAADRNRSAARFWRKLNEL
ncbi:MAG: DUF4276 family protein [Thermoflexales bacterium]|nr:DUF4276 family protein [Thermoflexales bacterium]